VNTKEEGKVRDYIEASKSATRFFVVEVAPAAQGRTPGQDEEADLPRYRQKEWVNNMGKLQPLENELVSAPDL
jgi:hypothetical protein